MKIREITRSHALEHRLAYVEKKEKNTFDAIRFCGLNIAVFRTRHASRPIIPNALHLRESAANSSAVGGRKRQTTGSAFYA